MTDYLGNCPNYGYLGNFPNSQAMAHSMCAMYTVHWYRDLFFLLNKLICKILVIFVLKQHQIQTRLLKCRNPNPEFHEFPWYLSKLDIL